MGRRAYNPGVSPRKKELMTKDHLEDHPFGACASLARKTGLTRSHISRVLRGKMPGVSFDAATRIADAAGVTLDQLRPYIIRG